MGYGLAGSSLAGGFVVASSLIPPAGFPAVLASGLGASASDVVTKAGSTVADASVNTSAELFRVATGIGGTETKYASFTKARTTLWGNAQLLVWDNQGANTWQIAPSISGAIMRLGLDSATYLQLRASDGYAVFRGIEQRDAGTFTTVLIKTDAAGRIDQSGTDSTGTPGAATIDKATGKSAIAAGAATVTITCSECSAASRLLLTFHARDATGLLPIGVPGAGSFTVTTTANCTAALPFSWQVSNIL